MGNRLTKIYTRTGDSGTTGMADGSRVSKADAIFAVMGDVDELNAHIGMVAAYLQSVDFDHHKKLDNTSVPLSKHPSEITHDASELLQTISVIQHLLFNVGGELAMPEYKGIDDHHILWLEDNIDRLNGVLPPLKDFILPAGSQLVSQTHIARTVCRRAERQAVQLSQQNTSAMTSNALKLLNRLSDWLFVLSRYCAKLEGSHEVLWNKTILDEL